MASAAEQIHQAVKQEVLETIETLKQQVTNHGTNIREIDWGHVGDLKHIRAELKDLIQF